MRILFVISDLTYTGAAKQLVLLATGLPPNRFQRRICVIGSAGPWADRLRDAGVTVDVFDRRWMFDMPTFSRLRHALRAYQADVLHVWGVPALRAVALAGGLRKGRLFVTASTHPRERLAWWDRWLLRRAVHVTEPSQTGADAWCRHGLGEREICVVPPGVEVIDGPMPTIDDKLTTRTILCIGPLKRHKGFRDAIWVLDMLRFLYPELQLALVGEGSDRSAIERFAEVARVADRVHFLGNRADLTAVLGQTELVWAPARAQGGINAILEAMAAGKPVVASNLPGIREIVADGMTGFLVPPGDQAALARQTRVLLDDAEQRRRMGEAGQKRARENFPVSSMLERFAELYETEWPHP